MQSARFKSSKGEVRGGYLYALDVPWQGDLPTARARIVRDYAATF
jgi:hypothetical protein